MIHLGEHLERLTAKDLRKLDTQVPLETLRAVVDLATEIGSEGREGKPVGTLFVVGDTRKVLAMSHSINFNPFRGYPPEERDVRDPKVREQIKDLAQLDGAIIIRRDGVAEAACMYIDALAEGITLSKGLGSRHWAAAAISRKTKAIAIAVSQSSGTVRIFQNGEVVLHIEPLARPMVWDKFRLEAQDANGTRRGAVVAGERGTRSDGMGNCRLRLRVRATRVDATARSARTRSRKRATVAVARSATSHPCWLRSRAVRRAGKRRR